MVLTYLHVLDPEIPIDRIYDKMCCHAEKNDYLDISTVQQ